MDPSTPRIRRSLFLHAPIGRRPAAMLRRMAAATRAIVTRAAAT